MQRYGKAFSYDQKMVYDRGVIRKDSLIEPQVVGEKSNMKL